MSDELSLTLPPPPRHVRRSIPSACGLALLRLFILPHTLVGLGLLLYVPAHFYVQNFGTPVTATVDSVNISQARKKTDYHVAYHYTYANHRYDESTTVDEPTFAKTHPNDTFVGRAAALRNHSLFVGPPHWRQANILAIAGMALFWNSILSFFLYLAWIAPRRQRYLAKYGIETLATVFECYSRHGKGTRYFIRCTFTTRDGQEHSSQPQISRTQYKDIHEGDSIPILYHPAHPSQTLLCASTDFSFS